MGICSFRGPDPLSKCHHRRIDAQGPRLQLPVPQKFMGHFRGSRFRRGFPIDSSLTPYPPAELVRGRGLSLEWGSHPLWDFDEGFWGGVDLAGKREPMKSFAVLFWILGLGPKFFRRPCTE